MGGDDEGEEWVALTGASTSIHLTEESKTEDKIEKIVKHQQANDEGPFNKEAVGTEEADDSRKDGVN